MLKENLAILKASLFSQFKNTGCFWSSSRWAADSLTQPMRRRRGGKLNILEAGAGTGAVTVSILKDLCEGDRLVVCEINSEFMKILKQRLQRNADYQKHKDNIIFFEGPIQDIPEDNKFDLIICALPFLNFELPLVKDIFQKLVRLSGKDTLMTYFEYLGIRPLSKVVSPNPRKRRIKEIDRYFHAEYLPRRVGQKICWLNHFPINIYTLDMAA